LNPPHRVGKRIGDGPDQFGQRRRKHDGRQADGLTDDGLQSHGDGQQQDLQVIGRRMRGMRRPHRVQREKTTADPLRSRSVC